MNKFILSLFLISGVLSSGVAAALPCGSFSISSSTYSYQCENGNQYMASATTIHCADGTSSFYGWIDDCNGVFWDTDIHYFRVVKETSALDQTTVVSRQKARDSRTARAIWSRFEMDWQGRRAHAAANGRLGNRTVPIRD